MPVFDKLVLHMGVPVPRRCRRRRYLVCGAINWCLIGVWTSKYSVRPVLGVWGDQLASDWCVDIQIFQKVSKHFPMVENL